MRILLATSLTALLVVPAPALADDESAAIVFDATKIMPKSGVHAGATGMGVELRFVPDDECMTGSIGGFAAMGDDGAPMRRDVLDVHFQIGFKPEREGIAPYLGVGLDVLHVTTHQTTDQMDRAFRGTTLGISAQGGVLGPIGDTLVYRATVAYMGAIVPGTGDDLGGLMFQLGLGFKIDD
jgi:hypothetical protein